VLWLVARLWLTNPDQHKLPLALETLPKSDRISSDLQVSYACAAEVGHYSIVLTRGLSVSVLGTNLKPARSNAASNFSTVSGGTLPFSLKPVLTPL
jgi:hypothetical protein